NCGVTLSFESKYHIDDIVPMIFSDGATFIRFEDNEIVIKLTEMKGAEVNGVKYQIKSYAN
ncbi:MAG: hypothetical protein RR588_08620, partial [Solibacillus sp.]